MNQKYEKITSEPEVFEALVQTKKGFSLVWLVPLVAVLIGGWLVFKAVTEKGPAITITLTSANGLEAGKTKIKYKDVEIGKVESIKLSEDFSSVIVTAKLVKEATGYLTERTRFWVVRARVAGGEITGLGTLFSGAYIAIDPGKEGKPERNFKALEIPLGMTADRPGRHFSLKAPRLGSLNYGSPVYYRQIKVGEVEGFALNKEGTAVDIKIFIEAPHHQHVRQNSRFWNTSGMDVDLSAKGVRIDTESFVSLMTGGIAFGSMSGYPPGEPAEKEARFNLYDNFNVAKEMQYEKKIRYFLYFDQSIRGLSVGAPVEFRGIPFGQVADINQKIDIQNTDLKIPVLIELEPERFGPTMQSGDNHRESLEMLVERGLRAQLKIGNLLTGQLFVELDYHSDAPPRSIDYSSDYPEFPTVPADLEGMMDSVGRFMERLDKIPVEDISKGLNQTIQGIGRLADSAELRESIEALNQALQALKVAAGTFNKKTLSRVNSVLAKMEASLGKLDKLISADAPLQYDLRRTLEDLSAAGRSLKNMADLIERHPEVLLRGKGNEKQ